MIFVNDLFSVAFTVNVGIAFVSAQAQIFLLRVSSPQGWNCCGQSLGVQQATAHYGPVAKIVRSQKGRSLPGATWRQQTGEKEKTRWDERCLVVTKGKKKKDEKFSEHSMIRCLGSCLASAGSTFCQVIPISSYYVEIMPLSPISIWGWTPVVSQRCY